MIHTRDLILYGYIRNGGITMKSKKWYKGLTATAIALALAGAAAIPAYAEDAEEMNDPGITTSTSANQTIDQAADAVIDKVIDRLSMGMSIGARRARTAVLPVRSARTARAAA